MKWITRERPKIDRIACPWLIRKFIDAGAEIYFAPTDEVLAQAEKSGAIPFDVPGVKFSHEGDFCTFDKLVKEYSINDPAIDIMAEIVRGADTDNHQLAKESAGLWAVSAGLAYNFKNDYELLEKGMMIYDALYSWAKHLYDQKHTAKEGEDQLFMAFKKLMSDHAVKKNPEWATTLKALIQDQIDTSLSLKDISQQLDLSPSYVSRTFSRFFGDLSFGEYIRKQRIEKACLLMENKTYTLTDIAYLTGFSDQSHFNRIFKKETGLTPSAFRKKLFKR
jgi:AraC-like DNA-binding protein